MKEDIVYLDEIESIEYVGLREAWDLCLPDPVHHFYANDILVSNSLSYAINGFKQLYQKYYYPIEFYTVLFNNYKTEKIPDLIGAIVSFPARKFNNNEIKKYHIKLNPPSLERMNCDFEIADDGESINYGLSKIKFMSENSFNVIKENIKEEDLYNPEVFLKITRPVVNKSGKTTKKKIFDKKVFLSMLYSGAFDYLNQTYEELITIFDKKLLEVIPYDKPKKMQNEQLDYIGFSKEKYETETKLFAQLRESFPQGLEYIFDDEIKECNQAVDYVKVIQVTNKTTKGGKQFKTLKVSCMGRSFSPVFIWDPTINTKTGDDFIGFFKKNNGWVSLYNKVMVDEL